MSIILSSLLYTPTTTRLILDEGTMDDKADEEAVPTVTVFSANFVRLMICRRSI